MLKKISKLALTVMAFSALTPSTSLVEAQTLGEILGGEPPKNDQKVSRSLDALYGTCMAPGFDIKEFAGFAEGVGFEKLDENGFLPMMKSPVPQIAHQAWLVTDWQQPLFVFYLLYMESADGVAKTCMTYFGDISATQMVDLFKSENDYELLAVDTEQAMIREIISVTGHPSIALSFMFSARPEVDGVLVSIVRQSAENDK